jgi:hypothetical protein
VVLTVRKISPSAGSLFSLHDSGLRQSFSLLVFRNVSAFPKRGPASNRCAPTRGPTPALIVEIPILLPNFSRPPGLVFPRPKKTLCTNAPMFVQGVLFSRIREFSPQIYADCQEGLFASPGE